MSNERFPMGEPVNRPKQPDLVPVPNRPGWWKDRAGVERYIEPPRPTAAALWDAFVKAGAKNYARARP